MQHLFALGKSMSNAPLRLIYTLENIAEENPANIGPLILQAGVGAPTKQFKKAVQRNRVKRLLREAYRLEKPNFISQAALDNKRVNLFLLYTDALVLTQVEIQGKLKEALSILVTKLNK